MYERQKQCRLRGNFSAADGKIPEGGTVMPCGSLQVITKPSVQIFTRRVSYCYSFDILSAMQRL